MSRVRFKSGDVRLPADWADALVRETTTQERKEMLMQKPFNSGVEPARELQRSFHAYLNTRHVEMKTLRFTLKETEYEQLAARAEAFGLTPSRYAAYQLTETDPRGIMAGMPFATAIRLYTERLNQLEAEHDRQDAIAN